MQLCQVTDMRNRVLHWAALALFLLFLIPSGVAAETPSAADSGTLEVKFIYLPPGEIHPSYHTAIWLESEDGKFVKTLFVSQELSATEFKLGNACPDWVKQANWTETDQTVIDAVTGPTPLLGGETLTLDLAERGVVPGTYRFRFEVHFADDYNTSFTGALTVGGDYAQLSLEKQYLPTQPDADEVVRDLRVYYHPKEAQAEGSAGGS